MPRIAIIGNAGGGKSTLARKLAAARGLPHTEIDRLLWQDGWRPTPVETYERAHGDIIGRDDWVIDGLGRQASIPARLRRATEIVLIDMPLWVHFWLAAERQVAWTSGTLEHAPAGMTRAPPTEALFRTIWEVDRDWMPDIRALCRQAETGGAALNRIDALERLDQFTATL